LLSPFSHLVFFSFCFFFIFFVLFHLFPAPTRLPPNASTALDLAVVVASAHRMQHHCDGWRVCPSSNGTGGMA
jgi:hypothetical protein